MHIDYLANHQEFIPALAQWHFREWAYLRPGDSVEACIAGLRKCCGHREIPMAVIAFADHALIGSALLIAHDMDSRMDLSPWLASVFTVPDHRRHGAGRALTRGIIDEATGLGVERLYLYTPSAEHFYSRLGWSLLEHTRYRGTEVAVMCYTCTSKTV